MGPFNVIFYEKEDGSRPAEDFILSQSDKMQAKLYTALMYLETKGPELREPYSKPLGDGIFELRAKLGSDITRVLYFFVVGQKVVVTNGFVKKTPKTPQGEIKMAKKYRNNYLRKSKKGGASGGADVS